MAGRGVAGRSGRTAYSVQHGAGQGRAWHGVAARDPAAWRGVAWRGMACPLACWRGGASGAERGVGVSGWLDHQFLLFPSVVHFEADHSRMALIILRSCPLAKSKTSWRLKLVYKFDLRPPEVGFGTSPSSSYVVLRKTTAARWRVCGQESTHSLRPQPRGPAAPRPHGPWQCSGSGSDSSAVGGDRHPVSEWKSETLSGSLLEWQQQQH